MLRAQHRGGEHVALYPVRERSPYESCKRVIGKNPPTKTEAEANEHPYKRPAHCSLLILALRPHLHAEFTAIAIVSFRKIKEELQLSDTRKYNILRKQEALL